MNLFPIQCRFRSSNALLGDTIDNGISNSISTGNRFGNGIANGFSNGIGNGIGNGINNGYRVAESSSPKHPTESSQFAVQKSSDW